MITKYKTLNLKFLEILELDFKELDNNFLTLC